MGTGMPQQTPGLATYEINKLANPKPSFHFKRTNSKTHNHPFAIRSINRTTTVHPCVVPRNSLN